MPAEIIFEAKNMHKEFGPIIALKSVDFTLRKGEIRGLVGENGSGKSTIMSIAAGMQPATSGEMFYKGEPWKPHNMIQAQHAGISMILQESNTITGATVAENIFAGREDEFTKLGILRRRAMNKAAQKMLDEFGLSRIRAEMIIDAYTFEDRKLIEIVRCVNDDTEILVVDETTTALAFDGRKILYQIIHKMVEERNKSVVFISHDLDEIVEQCTCLTVLRDGDIIGHLTKEEMVAEGALKTIRLMMVGREIGEAFYREDHTPSHLDEVALEMKNVSFGPINDFNLTLHKGEIIGIGGLSDCGMHMVGKAAFGLLKLRSGSVVKNGVEIKNVRVAVKNEMGYISKNRDQEALMVRAQIDANIALPSLDDLNQVFFISPRKEKKLVDHEVEGLRIKCTSSKQWINTLSGGNKQKVSFAKWTAKGCDVLIMDCPTRGVDVAVKQAMYKIIENIKNQGNSIIMISEELPELIGMVDKLVIMKDYKVTKVFDRSPDLKEADVIEYMI